MAYLGLARKYRPQKFSDLTGQEIVVKILQNSLQAGKIAHAYVFSGPKGVGKTSTARILAKALNCADANIKNRPCDECSFCIAVKQGHAMNVIEIDAASHTSVENIRDLRENVRYASAEGLYKVYIIDEAHMLSQAAFNAFLKTLEEPPPHVVFVLATTEPRKIPITVLSRCQHLQFRRIPINLIKERLKYVCQNEGIQITEEALHAVAASAEGSMRDALTLLDQITAYSESISLEDVNLLIGGTDIKVLHEIAESLIEGDREKIVLKIEELNDIGTDFKILMRDLINFFRNLLIIKITPKLKLYLSEAEVEFIQKLKSKTSEEHILLLLKELINAEFAVKTSLFPRIIFEITLLKLSMLSRFKNIDLAIQEISSASGENPIQALTSENDNKPIEPEFSQNINYQKEKIQEPSATSNQSPTATSESQTIVYQIDKTSIKERWSQILEQLEDRNHILTAKIKQAEINFEDNEIQLIYSGGSTVFADFVKERVAEIYDVMKNIGLNAKITVIERKNNGTEAGNLNLNNGSNYRERIIDNELVKKALQLFDGRIFNITPKNGGKR